MAELRDPNALMRAVALASTIYVAGTQALYTLSEGTIVSVDRWENLYLALMASYAAAPEVKILAQKTEEAPDSWGEKIRKGGPFIAFWSGLMMAIGALRLWRPECPMPPELESITIKTIGIFFGTYALRQYRRGKARKVAADEAESAAEEGAIDPEARAKILDALRVKPQGLKVLSETLKMAPRTLGRQLKTLTREGSLIRNAQSPTDPQAVYRLP